MDSSIFTAQGKYLMLALDQRDSFKKLMSKEHPELVEDDEIVKNKRLILKTVSQHISGVLIDQDWGLPAYRQLDLKVPFLLPAEQTGYLEQQEEERETQISLWPQEIKKMGAKGTKLLVYFNPQAKTAQKQINTAKEVLEKSHQEELPLFLEIVRYGSLSTVEQCVGEFINNGVIADVFKLEPPQDKQECANITSLLNQTPWIILTRGIDFELFCGKLSAATSEGCSGFLAGRSLWQELLSLDTKEKKQEFLDRTLLQRLETIKKIVLR